MAAWVIVLSRKTNLLLSFLLCFDKFLICEDKVFFWEENSLKLKSVYNSYRIDEQDSGSTPLSSRDTNELPPRGVSWVMLKL